MKRDKEKEKNNQENIKELIEELILFNRDLPKGPDQKELHSLIRKIVNNVLELKQVLRFIQMKIDNIQKPTATNPTNRKSQSKIWEDIKKIFKKHIENIEK